MSCAIETRDLSKRFHCGKGVEALDLQVPTGSIYAFLGPNGAGKTTTIRLLLGLIRADAGRVLLDGRLLDRSRRALAHVGALVETPSLYPHLSGRQNLEVTRRLLGLPLARIDAVLEIVDLRPDAERRVQHYSLGMRQRLGIALALLASPRLLVLDEPGNGLDPAGTAAMRTLLRRFCDDLDMTVFVSSHLLPEVQQFANHVGVLVEGRLCFQGPLDALRKQSRHTLRLATSDDRRACALLAQAGEAALLDGPRLIVRNAHRRSADINRMLLEAGLEVSHLSEDAPDLESIFFDLTARAARVAA